MCNHHHNIIMEHFHHLQKENFYSLALIPSTPRQLTAHQLSVSLAVSILGISWKWLHIACEGRYFSFLSFYGQMVVHCVVGGHWSFPFGGDYEYCSCEHFCTCYCVVIYIVPFLWGRYLGSTWQLLAATVRTVGFDRPAGLESLFLLTPTPMYNSTWVGRIGTEVSLGWPHAVVNSLPSLYILHSGKGFIWFPHWCMCSEHWEQQQRN